jgi:hypothetical protein
MRVVIGSLAVFFVNIANTIKYQGTKKTKVDTWKDLRRILSAVEGKGENICIGN